MVFNLFVWLHDRIVKPVMKALKVAGERNEKKTADVAKKITHAAKGLAEDAIGRLLINKGSAKVSRKMPTRLEPPRTEKQEKVRMKVEGVEVKEPPPKPTGNIVLDFFNNLGWELKNIHLPKIAKALEGAGKAARDAISGAVKAVQDLISGGKRAAERARVEARVVRAEARPKPRREVKKPRRPKVVKVAKPTKGKALDVARKVATAVTTVLKVVNPPMGVLAEQVTKALGHVAAVKKMKEEQRRERRRKRKASVVETIARAAEEAGRKAAEAFKAVGGAIASVGAKVAQAVQELTKPRPAAVKEEKVAEVEEKAKVESIVVEETPAPREDAPEGIPTIPVAPLISAFTGAAVIMGMVGLARTLARRRR